ncbi:MAG: hypothetical protein ACFFDN_37560 [Candidatus Hodarchaeota archaeon]
MKDEASLKILFYLREFNPNVSIEDLNVNLEIEKVEIEKKIIKLVDLKIVEHKNSLYKLSNKGRLIVNGIYHDLGERIPPN